MTSQHALARVAERFNPDDRRRVLSALERLDPGKYVTSAAVLLARLSEPYGFAWGDKSNGQDVWAVVREGRVVTVMLRRKTQPMDPSAFRVDRVVVGD